MVELLPKVASWNLRPKLMEWVWSFEVRWGCHLQQMNVQYCVSRPLKILIKIEWRKMKPPSNIRTQAPHVIIDLDFGESKFGWSSHWHMSIKLQLEACMILDAVQILSWRQDMIKYDGRGKIYLFFSSTVTSANSQKMDFHFATPCCLYISPRNNMAIFIHPSLTIPQAKHLRSMSVEIQGRGWTLKSSCLRSASCDAFAWTPPHPRCGEHGSHTWRRRKSYRPRDLGTSKNTLKF